MLLAIALLFTPAARAVPDLAITVTARSIRPGELVVLTIETPVHADSLRVRAFNRDMPAVSVGPRQWRVLIGIDLEAPAGRHSIAIEARSGAETMRATHQLSVGPRHFPTRTLRVDEAYVHPPAGVRDRIDREAHELQVLWERAAPDPRWSGGFVRPVADPANSRFGTRSIFNGTPRSQHGGADFLSPAGRPVKAPAAAEVVLARELYFLGDTVVLDHGQGVFSILAHLSVIDVGQGDQVSAGQIVGRVGATGRVTGPHLHWGVRVGGSRVDPLSVLALVGQPRP
jgi:hypothetical protein